LIVELSQETSHHQVFGHFVNVTLIHENVIAKRVPDRRNGVEVPHFIPVNSQKNAHAHSKEAPN